MQLEMPVATGKAHLAAGNAHFHTEMTTFVTGNAYSGARNDRFVAGNARFGQHLVAGLTHFVTGNHRPCDRKRPLGDGTHMPGPAHVYRLPPPLTIDMIGRQCLWSAPPPCRDVYGQGGGLTIDIACQSCLW